MTKKLGRLSSSIRTEYDGLGMLTKKRVEKESTTCFTQQPKDMNCDIGHCSCTNTSHLSLPLSFFLMNTLDKDETIERLKREVLRLRDSQSNYYATNLTCNKNFVDGHGHIPEHGTGAAQCKEQLVQIHELDNRPRLNTSSYVNVVFEEEEKVRTVISHK